MSVISTDASSSAASGTSSRSLPSVPGVMRSGPHSFSAINTKLMRAPNPMRITDVM